MKLKALSIALLAMILTSCGNSQSTSGGSNTTVSEESSSNNNDEAIAVDCPDFTEDLKDYCKIDLSTTPTVEIKTEDYGENNIKYSIELAVVAEKNMDIINADNLSVAAVLWDKNGDSVALFILSEESKQKLAEALRTKGKTILTFCAYKDKEGEGLPLENANRVHIAWDNINTDSDSSDYQTSEIITSENSDIVPETIDMEMEGDI